MPVGAGVVHFVVDGADGCRTLLPAWMTEARAAALPMADIPRLSLSALRDPALSCPRALPTLLNVDSSDSYGGQRCKGTSGAIGSNSIFR